MTNENLLLAGDIGGTKTSLAVISAAAGGAAAGGPAGLPESVVKTLADALEKAFQMPEHQAKAEQLGLTLDVEMARRGSG